MTQHQIPALAVDLATDNHFMTVEERISQIEALPQYEGHRVVVQPVESDETGLIGGYQIHHVCEGCVNAEGQRRMDAIVLPPTMHIFAMLSTDVPYVIQALTDSNLEWPRKARLLEKLGRLV